MYPQRSLLLMLLALYIFSPTLFNWVVNPEGAWYRPFIIWAGVILLAWLFQRQRRPHEF